MMIGKVVMLMMARQKQLQNTPNGRDKYWREFEADAIKDLHKTSFLAYSRYPVALWCLGFGFIAFGLFITSLVVFHTHVFFDEIDGLSYSNKLIVSLLTLFAGIAMVSSARQECVRISSDQDWIYVEYKRIFRKSEFEGRYLHDLLACNIIRKGRNTFHENSLYFILRFDFADGIDSLEVAETTDFMRLKKQYIQICAFLDLPLPQAEHIKFIDESIITLEWKKPKRKPTTQNDSDNTSNQQRNTKTKSHNKQVKALKARQDNSDDDDDDDKITSIKKHRTTVSRRVAPTKSEIHASAEYEMLQQNTCED